MKLYTGHNAYLNKQDSESQEDYNKRISDWEAKIKQEQFIRIAELELVEQWVETERKRIVDKHKDKEMGDFDKGVEVALAYVSKYLEGKRYAREAIFNEPLSYVAYNKSGDRFDEWEVECYYGWTRNWEDDRDDHRLRPVKGDKELIKSIYGVEV